jgi:hypothetical protein
MIRKLWRVAATAPVLLLAGAVHANPALDAIGDNTWALVDSGGLAAPNGILAYSGMAYDSARQKLLVFGGGHCDYEGNEVWEFDIATLSWKRLYEPDPAPDGLSAANFSDQYPGAIFYPAGEPISEARPMTRHTYDTVEFLSATGEMFVTGNYTYGGGTGLGCSGNSVSYCWGCSDTWSYDPTLNHWTFRNTSKQPVPSGIAAAADDPTSGTMYVLDRNGIWSYRVQADTWTELAPSGAAPPTSIEIVAEYDSKRHVIYRFGGESPTTNGLWRYDIDGNSWTELHPSGSAPPAAGGWGLAYDKVNDVVVAYRGGAGTWIYDPTANSWMQANPTTDPGSPDRVHGDLKYDPANNVTLLVKPGIETWAYRYKRAAKADDVAPSAPTGLYVAN